MDHQQLKHATTAWEVAAQQLSYTAEAASFFADTANRSELATLQPADLGRARISADLAPDTQAELSSGSKLILLFAQSVLGSAAPSMLGISNDSTARITQQTTTPFLTTPAPLGSSPETPSIARQIVLLRSALLAVKAATLLRIEAANDDAVCNSHALWDAACSITGRMHDAVVTQEKHTESYTSESAHEAEHLAELLVQVLLQAMSQGFSRVAGQHRTHTCCSMLHALLVPHQHSSTQPLSSVVAAAITSQSESPMQPDLQPGHPILTSCVSSMCSAHSVICMLCAAANAGILFAMQNRCCLFLPDATYCRACFFVTNMKS